MIVQYNPTLTESYEWIPGTESLMLRHVIGELPIGYFIYNQIENKNNLTVEPTYGRGMGHMESCSHIIQLRQLVGVEVGAQTDDCNCNLCQCQCQSNTMQYYLLFRYLLLYQKHSSEATATIIITKQLKSEWRKWCFNSSIFVRIFLCKIVPWHSSMFCSEDFHVISWAEQRMFDISIFH